MKTLPLMTSTRTATTVSGTTGGRQISHTTTYYVERGVGLYYELRPIRGESQWSCAVIGAGRYIAVSPHVPHAFAGVRGLRLKICIRHMPGDDPRLTVLPGPNCTHDLAVLSEIVSTSSMPADRPKGYFRPGQTVCTFVSGRWYKGVVDSAVDEMPNVCVLVPGVTFPGLARGPLVYTDSPLIWPA